MLVQLTYRSTPIAPISEKALSALVKRAADRNRNIDVTGALLYTDGTYIQLLEGEEEVVNWLYMKIAKDPRHRDVKVISRANLIGRRFGECPMLEKYVDSDYIRLDEHLRPLEYDLFRKMAAGEKCEAQQVGPLMSHLFHEQYNHYERYEKLRAMA